MIAILKVSLLFGLILVIVPLVSMLLFFFLGPSCAIIVHHDSFLGRLKEKVQQFFTS